LPAHAAQFKDRGTLREGLAADIVVYDLDNLKALPIEIAYDLPAGEWRRVQKAQGYRWIMVNGGVTFEDGKCTGATPGKLLRGGRLV
jgi:N-acyl-D-aspartate/D-glutamate deacylase